MFKLNKSKNIKNIKNLILCVVLIAAVVLFPAVALSCSKTVATTPGNVTNYGYVLVDGNHVYYTKVLWNDYGDYFSNIYRYDTKSGDEILISSVEADSLFDMNAYLSLDGGYLYFLPNFVHKSVKEVSDNIYRVKPDGNNTVPEPLFQNGVNVSFMQIVNGTIYYYDDDEQSIYKVKTDGSQRQLLCEAYAAGITVGKDKIYYTEFEMIMAVSVNGGEPEEVFNFEEYDYYPEYLVLDGDNLYYLCDNQTVIGRIKTDGSDPRTIYSYTYIEHFNISGGTVFFIVDEYGPDGSYAVLSIAPGNRTANAVVSDDEDLGYISPIAIWDGTVYFNGMHSYETIMDSDDVWFTVSTGGGKITPFQPVNVYDGDMGWEDYFDEDEDEDEE